MPLTYEQPTLKDIPTSLFMTGWAKRPAGEDYDYLREMASHRSIQTSRQAIKRELKRRLRAQGFIEPGKRMRDADYQALKPIWLRWWRGDDEEFPIL